MCDCLNLHVSPGHYQQKNSPYQLRQISYLSIRNIPLCAYTKVMYYMLIDTTLCCICYIKLNYLGERELMFKKMESIINCKIELFSGNDSRNTGQFLVWVLENQKPKQSQWPIVTTRDNYPMNQWEHRIHYMSAKHGKNYPFPRVQHCMKERGPELD